METSAVIFISFMTHQIIEFCEGIAKRKCICENVLWKKQTNVISSPGFSEVFFLFSYAAIHLPARAQKTLTNILETQHVSNIVSPLLSLHLRTDKVHHWSDCGFILTCFLLLHSGACNSIYFEEKPWWNSDNNDLMPYRGCFFTQQLMIGVQSVCSFDQV